MPSDLTTRRHHRADSAGVGQPADLVTRFLANLIDGILLGVVYGLLVSFLIVGLIFGAMAGGASGGFIAGAVSTRISTALSVAYVAFMESSRGQTVGKMLMRIEVRGPDGQMPTLEQAIKRNAYLAIGLLGIIPVLGGLLAPLLSLGAIIAIAVTINGNTSTRQGWHDLSPTAHRSSGSAETATRSIRATSSSVEVRTMPEEARCAVPPCRCPT